MLQATARSVCNRYQKIPKKIEERPFCGEGGWGTQRGVGLHKTSVAKAMRAAKADLAGRRHEGHFGGGVPVLYTVEVYRNGKLFANLAD